MNSKTFYSTKKITRHKIRRIQSKKHKIGTDEVNKISLSCFDDKWYVLDDGVHTLAYFHKDCKKQKEILKNSHRWSCTRRDSYIWSYIRKGSR